MNSLDPMASQINVPLLRKALEFAETHPEEIELGSWAVRSSCGTTACIAGTIAILAGHKIDWSSATRHVHGLLSADYVTDGRHIESVAMTEIGIDDGSAYQLFYCEDLDEVWEVAEELTNGEIQRPVK
jgi:hypothetical protein